ncbi:MAG: type II toxin-antitoxin system CcdA family antitoxin, partial [Candidatus Bathyarchaeia archaeon]
MTEAVSNYNSTWKNAEVPRGKHVARHNKTATKTTVSVYLSKNLVEKARKQGLNLSRILEEALSNILNQNEAQNRETPVTESSKFLGEAS